MAGHRQVALDDHAPRAIARHAERCSDGRGGDTGRPQNGARIEPFAAERHAAGVNACHTRVLPDLHAQPIERPPRRLAQLRRERRENRRAGFDEDVPPAPVEHHLGGGVEDNVVGPGI